MGTIDAALPCRLESREGYLCIKDPSLYLDPGKVYKSRR